MPKERRNESSETSTPTSERIVLSANPVLGERGKSKLVRILLVGVYLCCICGLGMTLSIYYLFLWDSTMPEIPKITRRH